MDDEWISAAEAFALVGKTSSYLAAEAICGRANDGVIVAKAHTLIIGDRRTEDVDVPAAFWWARGHAALEQKWQSGDFETWIDKRVHCRAYGVTFLKRDIIAMLPTSHKNSIQLKRSGQGNFASASRSIDELQKQLSCTRKEAATHIARFCGAGLVEARCESFWCEVTDLFGTHEEASDHVAIPSWFWEKCALGPDAILDWRSGTFAGRGMVGAHIHRVRIKGAEFDVSGMVDMENKANIGFNEETGRIQIEIKGLAEPKSEEAKRICREDLNEVIATFVQDKRNIERGLFDKEMVPEELTVARMGKIIKDLYPERDEEDQEAIRQHAIAALNMSHSTVVRPSIAAFITGIR